MLDVPELLARPEKITIIANEYNPLEWHGWQEIGRFKNDIEALSSKINYVFTVRFRPNGCNSMGMAKITSDPVAIWATLRLDLPGVDVLCIK